MPKINDPTCLIEGALGCCANNIDFNLTCKTITLAKQAGLSDCGVTLQAIYSKAKLLWKNSCLCANTFVAYDFPFISITDEQYELVCGWSFDATGEPCAPLSLTKLLIRDGGWARVDEFSVRRDEYMGLVTLGNFDTTNGGAGCGACNVITCGVAFLTTCDTITRTVGSWFVDGFVAGGDLIIAASCAGANNGTFTIKPAACCGISADGLVIKTVENLTSDPADAVAQFTQTGTGKAYYQQEAAGATTYIELRGPVNQPVKIFSVTQERTPLTGLAFTNNGACADTIVGQACDFTCFAASGFVTISTSEVCGQNDGTFYYTAKSGCMCTTLTLHVAETLVTDADDITARITQADDFRNYFKIWLREEQKAYDFYDLVSCQNLNAGLANKKFALPLSDSIDNKVGQNDDFILLDACMEYNCITIDYYQSPVARCISCVCYCFDIEITSVNHALQCIYEFVQKELRQTTDICDRGVCTVDAAEITAVTLPAQSAGLCAGDYWILNAANDQRKYHVWYTIACAGIAPVVALSTAIPVNVAACATACVVATATAAAINSVITAGSKNTNLEDFSAAAVGAVVTVTNLNNGRTTDASDVSAGATFCVTTQGDNASTTGEIQDELLTFVGCSIITSTGVFLAGVQAAELNSVTHTDSGGTGREFNFVATGVLNFNTNLVADGAAKYFMYYTCTPNCSNFGTASATLVTDPTFCHCGCMLIAATITTSCVCFTYNYDSDVTGCRACFCDVDCVGRPNITLVSIGLCMAQSVVTTTNIKRTKTNNISVVAALERNFDDPA